MCREQEWGWKGFPGFPGFSRSSQKLDGFQMETLQTSLFRVFEIELFSWACLIKALATNDGIQPAVLFPFQEVRVLVICSCHEATGLPNHFIQINSGKADKGLLRITEDPSLRKLHGFQKLWAQNQRQRPNTFYIVLHLFISGRFFQIPHKGLRTQFKAAPTGQIWKEK